jgi:DNA-binding transcriptional LysR family regulator
MAAQVEWELYRTFLAVARSRSLSGAARQLGIAQPTVGRHVVALEAALGLVLFTRSPAGLLPTEAALALQPHAQAMERTAAALARVASGHRDPDGADGADGAAGVVRVSVSEVVGIEVMPPLLAQLRARHPALAVELVLSNEVHDLLQREADIAVRMTEPRQEQLVARRVGALAMGLFASSAYLARCGAPQAIGDLAGHTLIGYDRIPPYARAVLRDVPELARERCQLRTDSDCAQLALIRAGAGIGACQVALARRDGLVPVLAHAFALRFDTWIAMHEDLRASRRCRVVFDALAEGLRAHALAGA